MGANTTYYVRVVIEKEEWRKISALTAADARLEAKQDPDVLFCKEVLHWSEADHIKELWTE